LQADLQLGLLMQENADMQQQFDNLNNQTGTLTAQLDALKETNYAFSTPVKDVQHHILEASVPFIINRLAEVKDELVARGPAPTVNRAVCVAMCGGEPNLVLDCGHTICTACNTGIKEQASRAAVGRRISPKCPYCRRIYRGERAIVLA
jgi:hypothetical protein